MYNFVSSVSQVQAITCHFLYLYQPPSQFAGNQP